MKRRDFVRAAAAGSLGFGATAGQLRATTPFPLPASANVAADFVIRGGLVYDGGGAPPFEADVAVRGEKIVAVARDVTAAGARVIDGRALAIAPGFIDIHSHTDLSLLVDPRAESKLRQGVTTEVAGADGGSIGPWRADQRDRIAADYERRYGVRIDFGDLDGFFAAVARHGAALNLASMVGAGTVRAFVVGEADRPATPAEIAQMQALVRGALAAGACGLSSGLEYTPGGFADFAELVALASVLRGSGLPYATHMRNEDDALLAAVEEAIGVARAAGVPLQISHLKVQGERNWWKAESVLRLIEEAAAHGTDVQFDRYPYVAYSTTLTNLFPLWSRDGGGDAFLARLRDEAVLPRIETAVRDKIDQLGSWDAVQITEPATPELVWARGRRLGALAAERGAEPFALLLEIVTVDRARTGMVGFGMSEPNTERVLAHPLAMICSDAGARALDGPLAGGSVHPRAYGSFPRVLGHYCRERNIMPLETAIAKMTSMPAARVGLHSRGRIAPGMVADIVAFDPDRIADRATFEMPHAYPVGIPHVFVAGEAVLRDGENTGALPGTALRLGSTTRGAGR